MKCGGLSEPNPADAEIQGICDQVKGQHEEKAGKKFDEYVAVTYSSQVVAGINYFVKVHVGDGVHHHVRIYKPLPHTGQGPEFSAHQADKTKEDNIEYF